MDQHAWRGAAAGHAYEKKLVHSQDDGKTWKIADDDVRNNFFVTFPPVRQNIVYADDKKSMNSGETFRMMSFLKEKNVDIMGICPARPDHPMPWIKQKRPFSGQMARVDMAGIHNAWTGFLQT